MSRRELGKPVRKLRKLLARGWDEPTPNAIHDLRTAARRFSVTLESLKCDSGKNERRSLREVERIRTKAGKVRDLDVLTRKAIRLHPAAEQDCLVWVVERIGADRQRRARKLQRLIKRDRRVLRRRLKHTAAQVDDRLQASKKKTETAADVLTAASASMAELAAPVRLNRKTLHSYRLKVKQLRDVLKATAVDHNHLVQQLSEVKDAIGEWHDWQELFDIAADTIDADHRRNCALLRELKTIIEAKYQRAYTVTTRLRKDLVHRLPIEAPMALSA